MSTSYQNLVRTNIKPTCCYLKKSRIFLLLVFVYKVSVYWTLYIITENIYRMEADFVIQNGDAIGSRNLCN